MVARAFATFLLVSALGLPALASGASVAGEERIRVEIPPTGLDQELRVRDGGVYLGRVISITADDVVFRTMAGRDLMIPRSEITFLDRASSRRVEGRRPGADAGATRLLLGPTGRSLPRGQGYAGVYGLFVPFVQVGVTDRVSVGAGTPIILWGTGDPPVWVTPKVQLLARERVQVAAGAIQFLNLGDANLGVAYGVMTYGSTASAITVGGGYGYASGDGSNARTGLVIIGGERRTSPRTTLIGEAWLLGAGGGLASVGIRCHGRRLSADLGMLVPVGGDGAAVAPMVNLAWRF